MTEAQALDLQRVELRIDARAALATLSEDKMRAALGVIIADSAMVLDATAERNVLTRIVEAAKGSI